MTQTGGSYVGNGETIIDASCPSGRGPRDAGAGGPLGRVEPEAILSISSEWRTNHEAYQPGEDDIRVIASSPVTARLDVWFYGLDRAKTEPARLARKGAVERVPTFILRVGGREIGLIVETPHATLEHDLALLFQEAEASSR